MEAKRLLELADEITELFNMSPEELDNLGDIVCPTEGYVKDPDNYFRKLGAFAICHSLAEQKRDYANLQECVIRHKLGLGGESVVGIVINTIDEFKPHLTKQV